MSESAKPSEQELQAIADDTQSLLPYKQVIVDALMGVATGKKEEGSALEELLAQLPEHLRPAARRRFYYEVGVISEEKKKRAAQKPKGVMLMGALFDMTAAVMLMAAGTYDKIRELCRRRPDIEKMVRELGGNLLRSGVVPHVQEMNKVEQIRRILSQAQRYEQQQQQQQQQQGRQRG